MKKKITIAAFIIAIGVWSKILFNFFSVVSPELSYQNNQSSAYKPFSLNRDTTGYALNNNYADPFLKAESKKNHTHSTVSSTNRKPTKKGKLQVRKTSQQHSTRPLPEIAFKGTVKNNQSGNQVAIVRIGAADYIMSIGETYSGIQLKQIFNDSIQLLSQMRDEPFYVHKAE